LHPPPGFLAGLEKNAALPSVLVGELVTQGNMCSVEDRADASKRGEIRNAQFEVLHKVLKRENKASWFGLRVKVFAFPTARYATVGEQYRRSASMMELSFKHHPHIGVCRMGRLNSTEDAIRMFNVVVQMGLEGIVIVNQDVKYRASGGYFFKLKPKIVLSGREIEPTGKTKDVLKDGVKQTEHEFVTEVSDETVTFTDLQPRKAGYARLKYMERIEAMKGKFPCNEEGYRHMHFASEYDMPVVVPCVSVIAKDDEDRVRDMLGLSGTLNIYNPRGFQMRDIVEETPIVPSKKYVFLCLNNGCDQGISQVGLICYVVDADGRREVGTRYHEYIDWSRRSFADVVTCLVDVFRDTSVVTTLILPTDMALNVSRGGKVYDVLINMMRSVGTQEVFNLIRRLDAPLHSTVVSAIKIERMAKREWSEKRSGVADPTTPVSRHTENVFEYACQMSMGYFDKLDARETGKRPKPEGSEARDEKGEKEAKKESNKEKKKPQTLQEVGRRNAGVYGRSKSSKVESLLMQLREMCV
jgi:hypothetical protein